MNKIGMPRRAGRLRTPQDTKSRHFDDRFVQNRSLRRGEIEQAEQEPLAGFFVVSLAGVRPALTTTS